MPVVRFQSIHATPPGGCYEYSLNGETVTSLNVFDICAKTRHLRSKHGLETPGDGMRYVMEYMCPGLPNGFCTTPSTVKQVKAEKVKANTALLFSQISAPMDVIEKRMEACVECPQHTRRGFCVDCTGLLDWVYRGYQGLRGKLPADRALGVCLCDEVLAAAGATVDSRPLVTGIEYPEKCWRKPKESTNAPVKTI
jgi:hypothetical protein